MTRFRLPNKELADENGIYKSNPRLQKAEEIFGDNIINVSQQEIIKSLNKQERLSTKELDYSNEDIIMYPGIKELKTIIANNDKKTLSAIFKNIIRTYKSVVKIELSLGNYEQINELNAPELYNLSGTNRMSYDEIGEKTAKVFLNNKNVVYFLFTIEPNGTSGSPKTTAKAAISSNEEYNDDNKFSPYLSITFIQ